MLISKRCERYKEIAEKTTKQLYIDNVCVHLQVFLLFF